MDELKVALGIKAKEAKGKTHWANSNARTGYQLGEGGSFPTLAIPMWMSGRRRDLCECRRPSAGSVLVLRQGRVDDGRKRNGWSLEVAAGRFGDFHFVI